MALPVVFDRRTAERVIAATRWQESQPRNRVGKRARWPVGTGGSLIAVEITQLTSGDPAAIYRTSHEDGFAVKRINRDFEATGSELTCYGDFLYGVHYTGNHVFAKRFGGKLQLVTTGAFFWVSTTVDAICGAGTTTTGDIVLFADGPTVPAESDFSIGAGQRCDVNFDDQRQVFVITANRCPPEDEDEEESA